MKHFDRTFYRTQNKSVERLQKNSRTFALDCNLESNLHEGSRIEPGNSNSEDV